MKAPLLALFSLLGLLSLTVVVAYLPFGAWKLPLALLIALAKTALIALVFMEWRREETSVRLASFAGVVWLSFLFLLAWTDFGVRSH